MQLRTLLLTVLAFPTSAFAVIIAGPNGAGANNTTQASLNSFITANSLPAFPYWGNVIQVQDASGIYMGSNGPVGYVLTAAHIGGSGLVVGSGTVTIGSNTYTVHTNQLVGSADLRIYRIGGSSGDPALPALSNVAMSSATPAIGTNFLSFGRGERVEGTANSAFNSDIGQAPGTDPTRYEWQLTDALRDMRWGTNRTENVTLVGQPSGPSFTSGGTNYLVSDFDDTGAGSYLTSLETQGAVGDSGGPIFTLNGANWELSGLALSVYGFVGQPGNTSAFGNATAYGNIATYNSTITGLMIPEPTVTLLLGCGLGLLVRRRK